MKEVVLPLDEAIKLAAKENLERDQRMGIESFNVDQDTLNMYKEEAEWILTDTGENYIPEYSDHSYIKVFNWVKYA